MLLAVPVALVVKRNQSAASAITSELTVRVAVSVPRLYAGRQRIVVFVGIIRRRGRGGWAIDRPSVAAARRARVVRDADVIARAGREIHRHPAIGVGIRDIVVVAEPLAGRGENAQHGINAARRRRRRDDVAAARAGGERVVIDFRRGDGCRAGGIVLRTERHRNRAGGQRDRRWRHAGPSEREPRLERLHAQSSPAAASGSRSHSGPASFPAANHCDAPSTVPNLSQHYPAPKPISPKVAVFRKKAKLLAAS